MDCELVIIEDDLYRKEFPPIEIFEKKAIVYTDMDISDLGSFEEISMTFKANVHLHLQWFDKRLTYANLKKDNDERNNLGKVLTILILYI